MIYILKKKGTDCYIENAELVADINFGSRLAVSFTKDRNNIKLKVSGKEEALKMIKDIHDNYHEIELDFERLN